MYPDSRKRASARLRPAQLCLCVSGLRATDVAAGERRSGAEEDEREGDARADSSGLPVEAGGDNLRLTDRARLALVAVRQRGVVRHRARRVHRGDDAGIRPAAAASGQA